MFCKKPGSHKLKNYLFCVHCSSSGIGNPNSKPINEIFFCESCFSSMKAKKHATHATKLISMADSKFANKYHEFIQLLREYTSEIFNENDCFDKNISLKETLINLSHHPLFVEAVLEKDFQNILNKQGYRQWLVKGHFWQCERGNPCHEKFKADLKENFLIKPEPSYVEEEFVIKSIPDDQFIRRIEDAIRQTELQLAYQSGEAELAEFFLQAFNTYKVEQCINLIKVNDKLILKFPYNKALYLSKVRLCQLIPRANTMIPGLLAQVIQFEPEFQNHELHYFFLAQAKWQASEINMHDPLNSSVRRFKNLKNNLYYTLTDIEQYTLLIEQCLEFKKSPAFYSSLGIGYLLQNRMFQARESFQMAIKGLGEVEVIENNKLWGDLHSSNKSLIDFGNLIGEIESHSMHFVVNLCKFFKANKLYPQLLECCERLCERQQNNEALKFQCLKAQIQSISLKAQSQQPEMQDFKDVLTELYNKIESMKKKSLMRALKLQKKLLQLRGKGYWREGSYEEASEMYREAVGPNYRLTSTDHYNLAVNLFKKNEEKNSEDEYRECLREINAAISMKPKQKYLKFKFFVLCYLGEYESAKNVCDGNTSKMIPGGEYDEMREFINDNAPG